MSLLDLFALRAGPSVQTLDQALARVEGKVDYIDAAAVGSAYTASPEQAADFDLLLLVKDKVEATGQAMDFAIPGGSSDPQAMQDCWQSMRMGDLNILLCSDPEFFRQFKVAAEVCKYLKLTDKEKRVMVHRIIMDGWTAGRCNGEV